MLCCVVSYIAYYDGTDIGRPVIVDNSTGVPQYEYIEVDGYHPPSNKTKRGATAYKQRLWPKGKVYFQFDNSFTGKLHIKILLLVMLHLNNQMQKKKQFMML